MRGRLIGKPPDSGSGDCRFESCPLSHFKTVNTVNKEVFVDPMALVLQDVTQLLNDLLGLPQVIQMTLDSIVQSAQALSM